MKLTEKDAAIAYAKTWNKLDCSHFLELLDENAHYASQYVFEELESKTAISEYLIKKINTVKETGSNVYAELGKTQSSDIGRDCVCIAQSEKKEVKAIVLFDIENNKIKRYDLCIPELFNASRTGVYPV